MASGADAHVLEVAVLWRGDLLSVAHRSECGAFFVGEEGSACDVALPEELLGAREVCVAMREGEACFAVAPQSCEARLVDAGGRVEAVLSLPPRGEGSFAGGRLIRLAVGVQARLGFGPIEVRVALVDREPAVAGSVPGDPALWSSALAAGGLAGLLLWLGAWSQQPAGLNSEEGVERAQLQRIRRYLDAATQRSPERDSQREVVLELPSRSRARALPRRSSGDGQPGSATELDPSYSPLADTFEQRMLDWQQARQFGLVEALRAMRNDDYAQSFAFVDELDADEVERGREAFSEELEDAAAQGVRLRGTGSGAGGKAEVLPLGTIRTVAKGEGSQDVLPPKGLVAKVSLGGGAMMRKHEGVLDRKHIETLPMPVRMRLASIRRCVRTEVGDSAPPPGLVQLKLLLDDSSRPHRVRATGPDWAPRRVLDCVEGAFYGVHFAELSGHSRAVAISVTL